MTQTEFDKGFFASVPRLVRYLNGANVASDEVMWYNGGRNIVTSRDAANTPSACMYNLVGGYTAMDTISSCLKDGNTPYSVYALTDPRNETVRYVGISKNANKRYRQHIQSVNPLTPKGKWICELASLNLFPKLTILETVAGESEARKREIYWIDFYSRQCPLLNTCHNTKYQDGGTRIDDPEMMALAEEQIQREIEWSEKFSAEGEGK